MTENVSVPASPSASPANTSQSSSGSPAAKKEDVDAGHSFAVEPYYRFGRFRHATRRSWARSARRSRRSPCSDTT